MLLLVFLDKGFKYESNLCKGCHELMEKAKNLCEFKLVESYASIKGNNYRSPFW